MHTISVSALNEQIKHLLEESFSRVFVEGELSRITFHNSGHIYFTLKDGGSAISAVMFRGNASKLKFRLEEGMKVIIDGAITLYKPRGTYQINCFSIEPSGQGALALAYEQLKQKLSSQGYFNPEKKKVMPKFPTRIALITSATGAALQDMLRVATSRWNMLKISVYDVLVQGDGSANSIAKAIQDADGCGYDVIVIGRGGGSIEDLWSFNEEIVADAIYYCKTPLVSAVGHEIDWVISDYVADLRAPTPSAAMEMILPDKNEILLTIDSMMQQFTHAQAQKLHNASEKLEHLKSSYEKSSIENRLNMNQEILRQTKEMFNQKMGSILENFQRKILPLYQMIPHQMQYVLQSKAEQIKQLKTAFLAQDPKLKNKKGFAQISKDSKVIELEKLKVGDDFEVMTDKVVVQAHVKSKRVI